MRWGVEPFGDRALQQIPALNNGHDDEDGLTRHPYMTPWNTPTQQACHTGWEGSYSDEEEEDAMSYTDGEDDLGPDFEQREAAPPLPPPPPPAWLVQMRHWLPAEPRESRQLLCASGTLHQYALHPS